MFRPYWPSLGIKYIIFKTQNKKLIYFEFVRSQNLKKVTAIFMQLFNIGTF